MPIFCDPGRGQGSIKMTFFAYFITLRIIAVIINPRSYLSNNGPTIIRTILENNVIADNKSH